MTEKPHRTLPLQCGQGARETGSHSATGLIAPRHDFQFRIGHHIQHAAKRIDQQIGSLFMADVAHVQYAHGAVGYRTAALAGQNFAGSRIVDDTTARPSGSR